MRCARLVVLAGACLLGTLPAELQAQDGVVFGFHLGYKSLGGDLGEILDSGIAGEYDFSYQKGAFRYGIGFNLVSFDIVQYDTLTVSQVTGQVFATWLIRPRASLIPYAQVRLGVVRYRPEGGAFSEEEPEEEGENPAKSTNGFEGTLMAGVQYSLTSAFGVDVSGGLSYVSTGDIDLSAIGLDPTEQGTAWTVRLGVTWKP